MMTKHIITIAAGISAGLLYGMPAMAAQTAMPPAGMPMAHDMSMDQMHMAMHPPELAVTAAGSVDYVPDIAKLSLGIRADSPSAATAVDTINKNTASVIAALRAQGVSPSAIKTLGYNLFYREPPNPIPAPGGAAPVALTSAPSPAAGTYQASEVLSVTVPVAIAGKALDAAISAGANESFGLSYQTSNADALYRQALAKAMTQARETADALAKAAHVSIVQMQSISNVSESGGVPGVALAAAMPRAQASVLPGSDTVTATVSVVYRIR
jgi:uncharacterized protein